MKEWLESWRAVATLIAMVTGGTLWVTTSITDVRTDLHALELRMETRIGAIETKLGAVEAKLDLLIAGLDIQIGEDQ